MKCLYCGQRLALLRKLTDSEFCSAAHRRQYHHEQEKLALARLVDAQKRFSTVTGLGPEASKAAALNARKPKAIAAADPNVDPNKELRGFLSTRPGPTGERPYPLALSAAPLAQRPPTQSPPSCSILELASIK